MLKFSVKTIQSFATQETPLACWWPTTSVCWLTGAQYLFSLVSRHEGKGEAQCCHGTHNFVQHLCSPQPWALLTWNSLRSLAHTYLWDKKKKKQTQKTQPSDGWECQYCEEAPLPMPALGFCLWFSQSLSLLSMHKPLQNYQGHFPLSIGHAHNFPSKRQVLTDNYSRMLMPFQKEWCEIFLMHPTFTKLHQFQFFRL